MNAKPGSYQVRLSSNKLVWVHVIPNEALEPTQPRSAVTPPDGERSPDSGR